jgi:phosphoribosylglycinamide formyltransferase-1
LKQTRCSTAILISGGGTNLQSFINFVANEAENNLDLSVVLSNRPDAYGLERARKADIPTVCIEHQKFPDRESFDEAVAEALDDYEPGLLILAGFMRILSAGFVQRYAGRILNIHPALLPAYPGLNTHQRVLDAGETWHGSTVHFVTETLDEGPGILQGRIRVNPNETAEQLATRVQTVEHQIFPEAANWFATGRATLVDDVTHLDNKALKAPVLIDFSEP